MKDVLLITNYWHFECEKKSSRYRTLADMIIDAGMNCEIVTSDFYHMTKKFRKYGSNFIDSFSYKVTLVHECGYYKNISFKRLLSCKLFANNVMKYLKKREKPDVIYLVVPSIDVADAVSKYALKNNITLIVDIQDLWPEAFKMAFNVPFISDLLFSPMTRKVNRVYSRADHIVGVSDIYRDRGLSANSKDKIGTSVYIGADMDLVTQSQLIFKDYDTSHNEEFWISYIGSLGHSYNINLISDALKILEARGINNIVFKVMGSGVKMEHFKNYASDLGIKADFYGQVEYGKMIKILMASELAVNPIISTSVSTIINKVADYAAVGIPVINTQNSTEYKELLEKYECGINCECDNAHSVANAIEKLYRDATLREKMRKNANRMGIEKFNRKKTYSQIINLIIKC